VQLRISDDCSSRTAAARRWVLNNASRTLGEIEKATLRRVALKLSESLPQAAERLGIAAVSLSRWIDRRRLCPTVRALEAFEQTVTSPVRRSSRPWSPLK